MDKVFADGFFFKRKEAAPEFVVGAMSVKVDDAISFLKQNQKNGWVNVDIKQSQNGKYYMQLDTWEPTPKAEPTVAEATIEEPKDDLPF